MKIFFNNHILFDEEACVSISDRGLLLGDGFFTTLKADHGHLCFFEKHYLRLKKTADILSIPLAFSSSEIFKICQQLLAENHLEQSTAAIRITLTRGICERGLAIPAKPQTTFFITTMPLNISSAFYPKIFITTIKRNALSPLIQLKTLNYLESILAYQEARANHFDDGIMLNTNGLITECSKANLFFIKGNKLVTPRIENGIFPGITREIIINLCKENKISFEEKDIDPTQISTFEAAFQTNSLVGIQPISAINTTHLSFHHPLTKDVQRLYAEKLAAEPKP